MNTYGLDPLQVRLQVVRPTLARISLWSRDAENLILGTALVESNLQYLKQLGNGPALGPWQMEPATYRDNWINFLVYQPKLRADIVKLAGYFSGEYPDAFELVGNLNYACAMCRADYRRAKPAIPSDAMGLALYHKLNYNSSKGATDITESVKHFQFAITTYVQP